MTDKQIEEFFRNNLQDHPSPVPEDMWERINSGKEKERKFIIFWRWYMLGAVILISLLSGIYFIWNSNGPAAKTKTIPAVNIPAISESIKAKKEVGRKLPVGPAPVKMENAVPIAADRIMAPGTRTPVFTKKTMQAKQAGKTKNSILYGGSDRFLDQRIGFKNDEANTGSGNKIETQAKYNVDDGKNLSIEDSAVLNDYRTPFIQDESNLVSTDKRATGTSVNLKTDSNAKRPAGKIPDPLYKKTFNLFSKKESWFLEAYGSPDLPINNDKPVLANSYFKQELSYTFGLRLGKSFGEHFTGRIGIQYSRINETSFILDSGFYNLHVHYKSIDMPFLIGYRIKNPHSNLYINTGLILNVYTLAKLGSDFLNSIHYFRTYSGLSFYLGLNYARPINEKLLFFAEPYFRYRLSDMVVSNAEFTQKINIAGLTMGIRYQFSKGKQNK